MVASEILVGKWGNGAGVRCVRKVVKVGVLMFPAQRRTTSVIFISVIWFSIVWIIRKQKKTQKDGHLKEFICEQENFLQGFEVVIACFM